MVQDSRCCCGCSGSGVATLIPGQWIVAANVNTLRIIGKAEALQGVALESSPGLRMDASSGERGR